MVARSSSSDIPLCPSVTGKAADARIIGFIRPDGSVASIPTPIALSDEMRADVGPQPERKFRLAGACSSAGCTNWTGNACGLIDRMRASLAGDQGEAQAPGRLPACGIRGACVWWKQSGVDACRVCPKVVYNPSQA